jgi:hypothetical protein
MCTSLSTTDALGKSLQIGMQLYFGSKSFDSADYRFDQLIRPFIHLYDRNLVLQFLEGCATCYKGQATGRRRASHDHNEIYSLITEKFSDIAIDEYSDFLLSIDE